MSTLWFDSLLLPDGWARRVRLTVANGRVAAIHTDVDPSPADERASIGFPGLSNVHSHAFQRGMAGLAETGGPAGDNFWTWREIMYRFLDRLDPDDMEAIALQAYVEMLERGFTRVGEFHYLHHDVDGRPYDDIGEMSSRIASAAAATGIGLTLLPVFYAHGNFGGAPPSSGQKRFLNDVERFARLTEAACRAIGSLGDAAFGVAPHSLRAVTPEQLRAIVKLAGNGPIHIHAAEQAREVDDCVAWSGQRPVEWLINNAGIDSKWCIVHATHLSSAETQSLAASGAVAGLCPITEGNLGDGLFPAPDYLGHGGAFGIGSDSNIRIDPAEELRALEYNQRLHRRMRNVLAAGTGVSTGGTLFRGALAGGARAMGVGAGIQVGAAADIVSLNPDHPSLAGRSGDALLDSWIFAGCSDAIDCVWRAGRKVVVDGHHERRDEIAVRYRRVIERVVKQ